MASFDAVVLGLVSGRDEDEQRVAATTRDREEMYCAPSVRGVE